MKEYPKSKALQERASKVLAGGGASEFRKFNQPHPFSYQSGQGRRITIIITT